MKDNKRGYEQQICKKIILPYKNESNKIINDEMEICQEPITYALLILDVN